MRASSNASACGACVQACPTAHADRRKSVDRARPARSIPAFTTCAYCGVRLHLPGRDAGRRSRAHGAVEGRQGQSRATPASRAASPGATPSHQDRITHADDPRQRSTDAVARGQLGRGHRPRRRASFKAHPGQVRQGCGSAASPPSRCTNEETFLVQKLVRAGFGTNNVDTCAAGLPLAHRLRPARPCSAPRPARRTFELGRSRPTSSS